MTVRLNIQSLSHGGAAVARLEDGRVVFVTGACPGDVVEAEITAEHARHAEARVVEVVEPSSDRVEPPCPYFGECGGCQWQHVAYERQLAEKRQIVVESLQRIGGLDASALVRETVRSPEQYGYRNKVELLAHTGPRGLDLGYARASTHDIINIDSCLLLPRRLSKAPRAIRGALRYLAGEQDLGITRVALRAAHNTRDVEIGVWTTPGPFPRALAETTLAGALKATGVVRVIVKDRAGERSVSNVEVLRGKGAWKERLGGRTMLASAPSFFQVNTAVAEQLVTIALDGLDPSPADRVVDMYAGVGTFTLPIAERSDDVVAVESSRFALGDLRRNLEGAQLYADVVGGDAARELAGLGRFDRALVDPPRAGLSGQALESLAETGASRIVYVSCDPATLARDAKRLTTHGYAIRTATPVDLFPQTYHVETVAVFERVR